MQHSVTNSTSKKGTLTLNASHIFVRHRSLDPNAQAADMQDTSHELQSNLITASEQALSF